MDPFPYSASEMDDILVDRLSLSIVILLLMHIIEDLQIFLKKNKFKQNNKKKNKKNRVIRLKKYFVQSKCFNNELASFELIGKGR